MQEIEIFLNYIGRVELPAEELSGEEMAEEEKKRKCRQYRREYSIRFQFVKNLAALRLSKAGRERSCGYV